MKIVTGYTGKQHITSQMDGARNAGIVGPGEYVLGTGNMFAASVVSNNEIKILDGDGMMQGRHFTIDANTYESVTIANGLTGTNRNDIIVARYTKNTGSGEENVSLAVVQGTSTDGTPSDPQLTTGDIFTGDCEIHEMPLYRVPITGLNIGNVEPLFKTMVSMAEYQKKNDKAVSDLNASLNNFGTIVDKERIQVALWTGQQDCSPNTILTLNDDPNRYKYFVVYFAWEPAQVVVRDWYDNNNNHFRSYIQKPVLTDVNEFQSQFVQFKFPSNNKNNRNITCVNARSVRMFSSNGTQVTETAFKSYVTITSIIGIGQWY